MICQSRVQHVIFFLVAPKVRKAEELPGLKWDHNLPVSIGPKALFSL